MSTIGQDVAQAEEKADKWYQRFRKETLYFFLGCALFLIAYLLRKEDRKDTEHRRDIAELKAELEGVRAKLDVRDRELRLSLDATIMAQRKLIEQNEDRERERDTSRR